MRKFTVLALLSILLCFWFSAPVKASSDEFWLYGTIQTTPQVVTYNNINYSQFEFNATATNSTGLDLSTNFTVIIPTDILIGVALAVNQTLNMTGVVDVVGVPSGYFVADAINQDQSSWLDSLKALITLIGGIGKLVVTVIVQVIGAAFGVVVPSWVVTLAVLAATVASFVVWFKKLPKILAIIFLVLIISLIVSLAL